MAITYTATLNDGAVSVADANWSDAAGFNDGGSAPKLLVAVGKYNQTISGDLDQSGATPACDLIHFKGGMPRVVGSSNAPLIVKFDATYTDEPNLLWQCAGGVLYIEAATNACKQAVFFGKGEINIQDGEFETIIVDGPVVNVAGAADISSLAVVRSGHLYIESGAATLPTLRQSGGTCLVERRIETAIYLNGGYLTQYNTTGSTTGTLYINGGVYTPASGGIPTIVRDGPGAFNLDGAYRSVALGATAITNYGPGPFPTSKGLVTIGGGTTTDYGAFAIGGGGAVVLP